MNQFISSSLLISNPPFFGALWKIRSGYQSLFDHKEPVQSLWCQEGVASLVKWRVIWMDCNSKVTGQICLAGGRRILWNIPWIWSPVSRHLPVSMPRRWGNGKGGFHWHAVQVMPWFRFVISVLSVPSVELGASKTGIAERFLYCDLQTVQLCLLPSGLFLKAGFCPQKE